MCIMHPKQCRQIHVQATSNACYRTIMSKQKSAIFAGNLTANQLPNMMLMKTVYPIVCGLGMTFVGTEPLDPILKCPFIFT